MNEVRRPLRTALISLPAAIAMTALVGQALVAAITGEYLPPDFHTTGFLIISSLAAALLLPISVISAGQLLISPEGDSARDFCCQLASESVIERVLPFLLTGGGVCFGLSFLALWIVRRRTFSLLSSPWIAAGIATPAFALGAFSIIYRLKHMLIETCPTLYCGA